MKLVYFILVINNIKAIKNPSSTNPQLADKNRLQQRNKTKVKIRIEKNTSIIKQGSIQIPEFK